MNGKKPTYAERKILERNGLNALEWLVQKNSPTFMQLVNRESGEVRKIEK